MNKSIKKVELLSPCGSKEAFFSAINSGADAIYLGLKYSARSNAENFTLEDLKEMMKIAKSVNVKIYITLNILIKEKEILSLISYIQNLYEIGVDAIIVQDIGVATLIKEKLKDIEVHASTQMNVHSIEMAKFLKNINIDRIVLAREVSLKEIAKISEIIETETFIHGALCVSYSGNCLMSSSLGNRSGNRGTCTQNCRLPYTLKDKNKKVIRKGNLISPKDLHSIEFLDKIIETGTSSLKIEGRLKKHEFVSSATRSYRKAIDVYYNSKKTDLNKEKKELLQIFNREGSNKGYFFGKIKRSDMATVSPKNSGVFLGKISKGELLKLENNISLGDGVKNNESGFIITKIEKDNVEVKKAYAGESVKIYPRKYKIGDKIYKTQDSALILELKKYTDTKLNRKSEVKIEVYFKIKSKLKLKAYWNDKTYEVFSENIIEEKAESVVNKERLIEQISKTSSLPFEVNVIINEYEEGFLKISEINETRRAIYEKMLKTNRKFSKIEIDEYKEINKEEKNIKTFALVNTLNQMKAVKEFSDIEIILNLFNEEFKYIKKLKEKCFIRISPVVRDSDFEVIEKFINENKENIKGIFTSNTGIINKFYKTIDAYGDIKLNIYNTLSEKFYSNYLKGYTLSTELSKDDIIKLKSKEYMDKIFLIYGKTENMILEHCLFCENKEKCKKECEDSTFSIEDENNREFYVSSDLFCKNIVYSDKAISLINNSKDIEKIGIKNIRLDFTNEDYETTKKVLKEYKNGKSENTHSGNYKKGVL